MKNIHPLLLASTLLLVASVARADERPGGALESVDGISLPLVSSDAEIMVTGDIATVRVTQRFRNESARSVSARYAFPLPHDSAVHAMTMTVGDEIVRARIKKVEEAKQAFEAAKREGKTASLLEEHRANVFTQDVANIPGFGEVKIAIEYAEAVPREDGVYRLHFPMVVASRYDNGANGIAVPELQKRLPDALYHQNDPRMTSKGGRAAGERRVSVRVRLETGLPIQDLRSPTHLVEVDEHGPSSRDVLLGSGRVPDDRDFVLEYRLSGPRAGGGLVTHEDHRGGFFTLLLEPPSQVPAADVRARELVFVIDASCSMAGKPLGASRRLVSRMLDTLRPQDSFRIIVFGSAAHALQRTALPATADNVAHARRSLDSLDTMGGTEIELGLKAALQPEPDGKRLRMVVFLTDGYIGNEASVMACIHRDRRDARLFSFGIGDAVNRWLIEEMAIAGGGVSRIVGLDEDLAQVVERFAARLESPFLTDGWIDFDGVPVRDVSPSGPIDLYAGAPVRVMGRLPAGARLDRAQVALMGQSGSRTVRIPLALARMPSGAGANAIPVLWARAQIAERMRDLAMPRYSPDPDSERENLVEAITSLGLEFAITTQWTAFVAVAENRVPDPSAGVAQVPLPTPHGTLAAQSGEAFSGASTPEPAEWAAMLLLFCIATVYLRRRGPLPSGPQV